MDFHAQSPILILKKTHIQEHNCFRTSTNHISRTTMECRNRGRQRMLCPNWSTQPAINRIHDDAAAPRLVKLGRTRMTSEEGGRGSWLIEVMCGEDLVSCYSCSGDITIVDEIGGCEKAGSCRVAGRHWLCSLWRARARCEEIFNRGQAKIGWDSKEYCRQRPLFPGRENLPNRRVDMGGFRRHPTPSP